MIVKRAATSIDDAGSSPTPAAARQYQPLVTIALAFAAGIVLDRYDVGQRLGEFIATSPFSGEFLAWWGLAAMCLACWSVAIRRRHRSLAAGLLIGAVTFSGAAWHHLRWDLYSQVDVGRFAALDPGPTTVMATLSSAPDILAAPPRTPLRPIPGSERSRVTLDVEAIRDCTRWLPAAGRCDLSVEGHLLGLNSGDRVQVFGQLREPAPPMNPGGFNFAAHARTDRRLAIVRAVSPDCIASVDANAGWSFGRIVDVIRTDAQRLIYRHVGSEQADVASAILLGDRAALSADEIAPYFLTGTIHLLVVSGLHVGILALGLYGAMRMGWLPRRVALAVIMAVVVAFTLLTGAEPPVVRAGTLVVLVCIAAWIGRRGVAFNLLAAAAIFVLAINPAELFQTGTQLSFLAVATLISIGSWRQARELLQADRLDQLIAASRPWHDRAARKCARWSKSLLVTTGIVWLVAVPLVLYRFHVVTPIAVLISPVVWILTLAALWSGFLLLACGWVVPPLAALFGALCGCSLACLQVVVEWAEGVPAGHVWAPGPGLWWVLGFYAGLLAVMIWGRPIVRPKWQLAILCGWILLGLAPPLARAATRNDALRCSFIAMGHGESILLEMPGGQNLLYDAGSLGSPEYATRSIADFLWDRGIVRLDGIVLSHADVDHYNAVPGLLERFHVAAVYVSPLMFDRFGSSGPTDGPSELRRAIDAAGVPIREIWAGDRLRIGSGVSIDVLHPPRRGVIASDNANSLVLAVEHADRRILLPGDLESPGLEDLLAEMTYNCDVLLAPHHGSRRSDPPGLAAWCSPEVVVVSGARNADPVVRRTYERSGACVYNTGQDGAVEIALDKYHVHTTTFLRETQAWADVD